MIIIIIFIFIMIIIVVNIVGGAERPRRNLQVLSILIK